jgi:hypothetical protein
LIVPQVQESERHGVPDCEKVAGRQSGDLFRVPGRRCFCKHLKGLAEHDAQFAILPGGVQNKMMKQSAYIGIGEAREPFRSLLRMVFTPETGPTGLAKRMIS